MIYIITMQYPANKMMEVVYGAMKLPKLPSYFKKWDILTTKGPKDTFKQYNIVITARDKSDEALAHIYSRYMALKHIDGLKWSINACLNAVDAINAAKLSEEEKTEVLNKL
jgi:hypothetical protein